MAFFLIVPSVMVISILLVHALAKRLGLKIYYSTLIAVALLSFMIIFAATILSPVPDKKFLLCLGGLIALTSFLLTLTNNFLIKKQREEEKIFTEQVKAAYAEELKKDSAKPDAEPFAVPIEKFEWGDKKSEPEEIVAEPEKVIEPVENPNLPDNFPLENVFKPLDDVKAEAVAKTLQSDDAEPFEKPKPEENFPLQDAFKPLENKSEQILDNESDKPFDEPKPEENFPLQETFKALDDVKPEMLDKLQPEGKQLEIRNEELGIIESSLVEENVPEPAPVEEKILEPAPVEEKIPEPAPVEENVPEPAPVEEKILEPAPVEEKILEPAPVEEKILEPAPVEEKVPEPAPVEEKIPEPLPVEEKISEPIESLDSILDKAYDARAKGHIWQAIEHYKNALDRYSNDEYAPFVAIDLGNLYKENALYSKAIKTYEEALTLPTVKRNAATKKEFVKNLEYLRVVRDILLKHHALSTPFAKIPREILQEIDAEFQTAQLHSAQYK